MCPGTEAWMPASCCPFYTSVPYSYTVSHRPLLKVKAYLAEPLGGQLHPGERRATLPARHARAGASTPAGRRSSCRLAEPQSPLCCAAARACPLTFLLPGGGDSGEQEASPEERVWKMLQEEQVILNAQVTQKDPEHSLVIAVTTRAIFNLEEEHQLFKTKGKEEYLRHQKANEEHPLQAGTAFAFIKAVQNVNKQLLEKNPEERALFDVIVLSNNTPESGVRIVNSVKHYGLEISKFCFVGDEDSTLYLKSQNVKLFLSLDRVDVCNALKRGVSAAMLFQQVLQPPSTQLRVAFDGDSVLFSDETDKVFRERGLDEAVKYEKSMEAVPMGKGPMLEFAMLLGKIRKKFSQEGGPIRTYLVTARSGRDMGVRAIRTLRQWGLPIDEAFFMVGAPKGPILSQIQPHIFFDDGEHNIQGAQDVGIPSAWVPMECCEGGGKLKVMGQEEEPKDLQEQGSTGDNRS